MSKRNFDIAKESIEADKCDSCVEAKVASSILLFATTTCPNCKMAEKFLGDAGVAYEKVYADQNPDLAKQYGITAAPTLVVVSADKIDKIVNVSNIRKFADSYGK